MDARRAKRVDPIERSFQESALEGIGQRIEPVVEVIDQVGIEQPVEAVRRTQQEQGLAELDQRDEPQSIDLRDM